MAYLIFENNTMKFFTQEDPTSDSCLIQLNDDSVVKEVADDFDWFNKVITLVDGEIDVKENDPKKAQKIVEDMCNKLLANLVIENYKIIEIQ